MIYEYTPKGVCSIKYTFDIDGDIINSVKILGGCAGNLAGISKIMQGMKCEDVIKAFENTNCQGKGTSCPDQIAKALKQYLATK